ncbi:hypothetical protein K0M31_011597, partial [Melipona bicolor]
MTPPLDLENLITVSTGWCVFSSLRGSKKWRKHRETRKYKKEARRTRNGRGELGKRVSEKSK